MSFSQFLGRLLGFRNVESIDQVSPSLAAGWAQAAPLAVVLALVALAALGVVFYLRLQPLRRRPAQLFLMVARVVVLCLLLLFLAEPTLVFRMSSHPRPLLWMLFDGTDSMAIEDDLPEAERAKMAKAVGWPEDRPSETPTRYARVAYIQALLTQKDAPAQLLPRLEDKFRLKAFRFDRADGVSALKLSAVEGEKLDPVVLSQQLTTTGQVTAVGAALADLAQRHATSNLAGVVVFSDFDQNSGQAPLAAARQLGVPIYAIGVGPGAAIDLAVDLQAPLLLKKGERSTLTVTVRQTGLDGREVPVKLSARRLGGTLSGPEVVSIGEKNVKLSVPSLPVEFPFTPTETGRFMIAADVPPQEGEVVTLNNHQEREVNIRDDFLRLMFVEYEPTWEWRFIKEVFNRDRLVGTRGFRTFLRSADPKVRTTNELFLPTLTPQRSEFFANDVIFLGDMPAAALSTRFCEMVKEFVSKFGGGLVVISGPNFGPGQLAATPLADMLPVIVDADSRLRDAKAFKPQQTVNARQYDFMQLGSSPADSSKAWNNLGELPWYQPVARIHPMATVLLEHPTDTCVDGKTRQPLVAIRRYGYGNGEVVYLAFNETWRLRREYGETYYRQFWGQMIHRLGLSHALGTQKRFVVRTDRQQYQTDEKVVLTVEAYDENFEPLKADTLPDHKLLGELILPGKGTEPATANPLPPDADNHQPLSIPQLREGVFEAQIPVFVGGEHRVKVKDPITGDSAEVNFQVTSVSAERRSAVRNAALQEELAAVSNGKTYDLTTVSRLPDEIKVAAKTETTTEVFPLWNTWLGFGLVVALLLTEWLVRKLLNLP